MPDINQIRQLQQSGALTEATDLCEQVLNNTPKENDNSAFIALLGVLHCQLQQFEKGRECLQSLQVSPIELNAPTLTDIAAIHLLLKEPVQALHALNQALALQTDFYLAQARRGLVFMQLGNFEKALIDLQTALPHSPSIQHAALHTNLARCYLHLDDNDSALKQIEIARTLGGVHLEQWLLVAVDCYVILNRWEEAENTIQTALDNGIQQLKCVKLLALVLAAQDKHAQAAHTLRQALKDNSEDIDLLSQLAAIARIQGHYGEAVHYMQSAIKVKPEESSLWAQFAQLGKKHFDEQAAKLAAEKALSLTENDTGFARAEALVAMASVSDDEPQAEDYYNQALSLIADYVPARLGLGHLLLQWGRIDEAVAHFEAVTARNPVAGYGALINARRFPDDLEVLERIEKIAYMPSLQGAVSSSLLFDLAAAYEHRKDYSKAFQFVQAANEASRKFLSYNAVQHSEHCKAIRTVFSREFFEKNQAYGNQSSLPAFVLGMPRSGTTLVEQILGGHEDIFVAGEIAILSNTIQKLNAWERHIGSRQQYPHCVPDLTLQQAAHFANEVLTELKQYSPQARYIVDKLPHNFEHIGLIRLLFPNAPIIHVLREPRDVAISNYFVDYQAKFGGMGFAYSLEDIGQQLRDYQLLIKHWNDVLIKPILTIRYEDVVADTEKAARQILQYLQLEWTDSVLNYQNLERAVKTASVWQVRQPIYNTSTEKWRRYSDFLQPLETILNAPFDEDSIEPLTNLLPAGYFFQGMAYLQEDNIELAIEVFNTILQHNSHHAAALHMLGIAYYKQGDAIKALALLKQAITLQPRHAPWHSNLSVILNELGMIEESKKAYEKSQKMKSLQSESSEFWQLMQ